MASIPSGERLLIRKRYEVDVLHEGTMSTVFVGRDLESGREVVLKSALSADFERSSTLVKEREMLNRLDHPGIVRAIDLFAEDERTVLVLERVPGHDLEHLLRLGDHPPDEGQVRTWGLELAEILGYLHAQSPPVIYRDLKPSNIMVRPDGRLVLVDFGAARVRTESPKDTVALGTPGYAAPEQYGGLATDERADVYGLGVTLFELLTRRDPASFGFSFPPLRDLGVVVSPSLEAALSRATSARAADRFASMQGFREALQGRPRRSPLSLSLLPLCLLLALAACASLSAPSWVIRYIEGIALFALSAGLGYAAAAHARAPGDDDTPLWKRKLPALVGLLTAAGLGLAPLAMPAGALNAWARRVSFDVGGGPISSQGAPWVMTVFAFTAVCLGFLAGLSLVRRGVWKGLAGGLVFIASLLCAHAWIDYRRDVGQAPLRTEPPLWTLQMGTSPIRGEDTPGLRGTDGKIYHVIHASDDAYHVVDPAAGRLLWSGSVGRRHVLEIDERQHAVIAPLDSALQWRAVEDGRELMRWQAPAEIGRTLRCDDSSLLVTTKDGALVCVDRTNARTRWTWSKRGAEIDVSLADGRILVFDRTSSTLTALSSDRGQPVWARAVKPMRAFGGCRRVGQMTALVGADEVELIDASSGAMYMRVSLPSDGGGEQNRPMHLAHVDGEHFLVQRGDSIHAISTRDARIEWTTVLAGEHLVMHMTAPGRMYLETSSGKLLGLSMPTGQLTWEWWSGGFMQHLLPAMTARLSFIDWRLRLLVMQERPGSPLCLFDTATSAAVASLALPPGFTVTRVIDDGDRLLVLGRDPQMTVTLLALPRAENLMPFGHD